ncbi:DNA primase [Posidoniimonas polymericola]|uniref:DNA primase n=1 Tax=Posidoniimonas polymericola TaxID=2528002 RepID=A0A5C5XYM1_9BACT|nr:DNA primase [Posidoniimonas polymericola]TWT67641.1 DNA primase [Posidoniimonas polymericola]
MSNASPLDAKEVVRQQVDIVDVVGESYELRRQGRNYVCRCPWHDDTKPSLTINQERQSWRCWVCDIGGDVFSFVMKRDGIGFREALELLADRVGVSLAPARGKAAQPGGPGDKKTLFAAMAYAEQMFYRCLVESPEAAPARDYLAGRGIDADSIERHRIGFAPDSWDWLKNKATAHGFSQAVLARVGLVRERENKSGAYDFFRGRVMFPIHDLQSRPIAFGGRILPQLAENAGGKYVNSPETPLYSKSNQLYALHIARDAVQKEGFLTVMEGYTDVVMAHQNGLTNVVACCGTALGETHLKLIQRFTDSVALVLDGDAAGQRRASEVLELFVTNQVDLRILTLPENLDPCDFIATPKEGPKDGCGVEAFRKLLANAPDALQHKLNTATNGLVTLHNTHAATRAAEDVLATLAKVPTGMANTAAMLREQSLLSALSGRLRLPQEHLQARLVALRQERASKPLVRQAPQPTNPQPSKPRPNASRAAAPKPARPAADSDPNAALMDSAYENAEEHFPGDALGEPDLDAASFDSVERGSADAVEPTSNLPAKLTANDRELLELMLLDNDCARRISESIPLDSIESSTGQALFLACRDALEVEGQVSLHWVLDALPNERLKSALVAIDDDAQAKSAGDKLRRLSDAIDREQQKQDALQRAKHKAAQLESSLSENQKDEELIRFFENLKSEKNRQTGSLPTEG